MKPKEPTVDDLIKLAEETGHGTPILVIDDKRFYSRIFFLGDSEKDWLAALFKDPGGKWMFCSRFRYYAGPNTDPWLAEEDGGDRKSIMEAEIPEHYTKPQILKLVRMIASQAQSLGFGNGQVHELVLETNDSRAICRALEKESWCHFKRESVSSS